MSILRKFVAGGVSSLAGESRRWSDAYGIVVVHHNASGVFLSLEISPISQKGKKVIICVPARKSSDGWTAVVDVISKLVGVAVRESQPQCQVGVAQGADLVTLSFVNVLRGLERTPVGEQQEKKIVTIYSMGEDHRKP